jgi:hypothetical protein
MNAKTYAAMTRANTSTTAKQRPQTIDKGVSMGTTNPVECVTADTDAGLTQEGGTP